MKITEETTVGELMVLLMESTGHLSNWLEDPIIQFNLYSDGGFEITENYYKSSATCNSTVDINNEFTGFDISNNIIYRLIEDEKL